jgi:kumamolisin
MNSGIGKLRALLAASAVACPLTFSLPAASAFAQSVDITPLLAHATLLGHANADTTLQISLILKLTNADGARLYAERVNTPGDSLRGKFLTPAEFAASFGASAADYASVIAWAQQAGLTILTQSVSRTVLTCSGTVSALEQALATRFDSYRAPDGRFFTAATTAPKLPASIAARLAGIVGLSDAVHAAPLSIVNKRGFRPATLQPRPSLGGTGPAGTYMASDLRAAYDAVTLPAAARAGEAVAIFEQGGFALSDVKTYAATNKLTMPAIAIRKIDGYNGAIDDIDVELEAVLDMDMLMAMNTHLQKITVYETGETNFAVGLLDSLVAMADDKAAQIVSISYGTSEAMQGATAIAAEGQIFTQMAAEGMTVFVSSGDSGAYDGENSLNVNDPGSQPFVTSVGGTTLYTGAGQAWIAEITWNDLGLGYGATGGGVSTIWPTPSWQFAAPGVTFQNRNGVSNTMRNLPDVAALGDPLTGVAVYSAVNGGWLPVGGTSVAAPIWAGYASVIDSAQRNLGEYGMGFSNPTFYQQFFGNPGRSDHDILDGTNGNANLFGGVRGYGAGMGADNATGWGSIEGYNLFLNLILNAGIGDGPPPGPPTALVAQKVTASAATVAFKAGANATGYIGILGPAITGHATKLVQIGTGTKLNFSGLTPNTQYQALVWSISHAAATPGSEITFTTPSP